MADWGKWRKRFKRQAKQVSIVVEQDPTLVLKHPAHYHACITAYHAIDKRANFTMASHFDLIANDLTLAQSRCLKLSGRLNVKINEARECRDTACVGEEGSPDGSS